MELIFGVNEAGDEKKELKSPDMTTIKVKRRKLASEILESCKGTVQSINARQTTINPPEVAMPPKCKIVINVPINKIIN